MVSALALLFALLIDRRWGEPPLRLHPVVWMGHYLGWAGQRVQRIAWQTAARGSGPVSPGLPDGTTVPAAHSTPDYKAFWLAALYWIAGATIFSVAGGWLESALLRMAREPPAGTTEPVLCGLVLPLLAAVLLGMLLKPMLAWAMLRSEVLAVEGALRQSLPAGRERLSWLVSRDTAELSDAQVRESAIESLAENLNDSVVAPIFWFVLLGLPGAVFYRFANTADAMWGYPGIYQSQNWEWAGKWAARADDVLNWLPARLTGWLLALTCGVKLDMLRHEAVKTPSPNSGWPMAAMALALNIRLGKPGVYVLNPAGGEPLPAHTQHAVTCAKKVLLALIAIVFIALFFRAWMVA